MLFQEKIMNVAVVGAGFAGLTAGYRLAQKGHKVTIYEKDSKPGGLAQSFDFGGQELDCFYRHVFKSDLDMIALIKELGLEGKFEWIESKMGFMCRGKVYSFTTPLDLLRFDPIPLVERIRTGIMSFYLRYINNWKKYESITAKDWIEKYMGKKSYEVIWGPLLKQKFAERAHEIAMTWLYGRIACRFKSREKGGTKEVLGYMHGSYQVIVDALAERIKGLGGQIELSSAVSFVISEGGAAAGVKVKGKEIKYDAVLVTCAPALLKEMVKSNDEDYDRRVASLGYYGAINLVIRTKQSINGPVYWMNIADLNSPFVAVVEHTNFVKKEEYAGDVIIYIGNYISTDKPLYKAAGEEIKKTFFAYLKKLYPQFDESQVKAWAVNRTPFAQPVVPTGYSKIKLEYKGPLKRLYIANMSMIYPEDRGMSYSVRLGNEAAEIINTSGN